MTRFLPRATQTSQPGDLLNECLQAVEAGRATVESCAARYPDQPELAHLLRVMLAVHQTPRPVLAQSDKAAMRQRVLTAYRAQQAAPKRWRARLPRRTPRWFQVLAITTILLILFFTGSVGLIRAAESAVPGDGLYRVKRFAEQVQLWSAEAQARPAVLYHLALHRVDELDTLSKRGMALSDTELADLADSLRAALAVPANQAGQAQLIATADAVLQKAEHAGTLSAGKRALVMQSLPVTPGDGMVRAVTPTSTGTATEPAVAVGTDDAASTDVPTMTLTTTPTTTPTGTLTETPTMTPTETPTETPTVPPTLTDTVTPSATVTLLDNADANAGSSGGGRPAKTSPTPNVGNNNSNANGGKGGGKGNGK